MTEGRCDQCGYAYGSVGPSVQVAEQLRVAAALAGQAFGDVEPSAWTRTLIYNWPRPHQLDVSGLAAHTAHEVAYHLMDIMRRDVAGS
jgi:hypothetical protein